MSHSSVGTKNFLKGVDGALWLEAMLHGSKNSPPFYP